jgi:SAM-dependent methyltransferase
MNAKTDVDYNQCLWEWYANPIFSGYLKANIQAFCQERIPTIFGYYAIHLGYPVGIDWFKFSPINYRLCVNPQLMAHCHDVLVCGNYDELPIKSDSIDLLLLPHTLEMMANPEAVIKEAQRVLIPEGYILLMGFNSYRYGGLKKAIFNTRRSNISRNDLQSMPQVKKLLVAAEFEIVQSATVLYCPSKLRDYATKPIAWLEKMCRILLPQLGAVYFILAKKKVLTLTPISPSWKQQKFILKDQVTEPTTRGVNRERCD